MVQPYPCENGYIHYISPVKGIQAMTKERKLDVLQIVAEASLIYEIDKSVRYLYGNKIVNINRIPWEAPDEPIVRSSDEVQSGKRHKRKTPKNAGSGRLQTLIREVLASGKKTQAEISRVVRENGLSSGNTGTALSRMKSRGEVRRHGIYWMRNGNGR